MALTTKQKTFCHNIVAGMSNKDAYYNAYNSKAKEQVAWNEASKLLLRDDIQEYIENISKPLVKAAQSKALTEREQVKDILWTRLQLAIEREDDTNILKYTDQINRMNSEYVNVNRNIDDTQTNINELDTTTLLRLVE